VEVEDAITESSMMVGLVMLMGILAQANWQAEVARLKAAGDAPGALALVEKQAKTAATEDEAGFLLAAMGRRKEAVERFRAAIQLQPLYPVAHFHLGAALWMEGERVEAVKELGIAARQSKTNAEYWQRYAVAARESGDRAAALVAYQKVVALRPGCLECRNAWSFLLTDQGQAVAGAREARAVLKQEPKNLAALSNLGFALLQQNLLEEAIAVYETGVSVDPNSAVMHYNLGLALKQKDSLSEARNHLERAKELDGNLIEAHYTLGIVYWQQGEFEPAAAEFRAAVESAPDYAEAWAMYGTVLRQMGEMEQARKALETAIGLKPEDPGPYSQMAQLLRKSGDRLESERYLQLAAEKKAAKEAMQKEMFDRSKDARPRVIQ
jgi:tetratricopeptide (TPR) repeat protein